MSEYTVDYFIKKFEAIPEEKWAVGWMHHDGASCALGHCGTIVPQEGGYIFTEEGIALNAHFRAIGYTPIDVNDYNSDYDEPTPRARILAALADIKAKQSHPMPTTSTEREL